MTKRKPTVPTETPWWSVWCRFKPKYPEHVTLMRIDLERFIAIEEDANVCAKVLDAAIVEDPTAPFGQRRRAVLTLADRDDWLGKLRGAGYSVAELSTEATLWKAEA